MRKESILLALLVPVCLLVLYFAAVQFRVSGTTLKIMGMVLIPISIAGVGTGAKALSTFEVPSLYRYFYLIAGGVYTLSALAVAFTSFSFSPTAYAIGLTAYGIAFVSAMAVMMAAIIIYNLIVRAGLDDLDEED